MKNRRAAASPFSICWHGADLTGTATYTPGDPGKYSGPPEKCYPSEPPEVEVETLIFTTLDGKVHDLMFFLDNEEVANEICDLVMDTFQEEPEGPEYEPDEPSDMTDAEADADTLKSAGMGTDEDYGFYGDQDGH